jgi:hypothetical protein
LGLLVLALSRQAAAEYEDEYVSESDITASGGEVVPDPLIEERQRSSDKEPARVWLSLGVQQDLLVHQNSQPACGIRYTCFSANGTEYRGPIWADYGNEVKTGLALATTRALLGLDILIGKNLQIGTRLGYAFGGHPSPSTVQKFQPYHAELRFGYFYSRAPFMHAGVRPYWALGIGYAEISSRVNVDFYQDAAGYNQGRQLRVEAWRTTGRGFVAPTLGVQFAFLRSTAIAVELRLMAMLGTPGIAPAGGISLVQGF